MNPARLQGPIQRLEKELGCPVFVMLASSAGEYAVDLDGEAGERLARQLLRRHREESFAEAALVIAAHGGQVRFAETLMRTLEHLEVAFRVVLPGEVSGVGAMLAIAAEEVVLHPAAGVGACDRGRCVVERGPWSATLLEHLPQLPESLLGGEQAAQTLSTIAHQLRYRAEVGLCLARRVSARQISPELVSATSLEKLGEEGVAGAAALTRAGARVRLASDALAGALEALMVRATEVYGLFDTPKARFERSMDWADEVEFAPAEEVAGALLASGDMLELYVLDTGSPDPDAPRLHGRWVQG
ncbi:hypothetical protein DL240_03195 [Lujinxingia litoralis]|uniref:Uncharacterized protein n=1 Tax=Lujinxingia litoralis TaxID=2211119 RepID=A0A328CC71_9DELT|nr:hypothetical protein [Lujinxingia litoralis]RAL25230.1 hypothetical protein DL240_03195 [Lujinxingia litoralis]